MTAFTRHNPTDDTILHGRILVSPDNARAVIAIVHGFGEHIGRYKRVADALGTKGLAVIGLDLHGHGRTAGRRGYVASYERLREDVDMLLAEARDRFGDLPVFLWGHSMGGGLVLDYVFARGESGLGGVIATAPLIEAAEPPPAPIFALFKLIETLAPKFSIANSISGDQISTLPEEQALYESDPLNHDRLSMRLGLNILQTGQKLAKRKAPFPVPLLLMHARGDRLTRFEASERFATKQPDCNFHPFEGVAHEIHNDASREEVVRLIADFTRVASRAIQGETS